MNLILYKENKHSITVCFTGILSKVTQQRIYDIKYHVGPPYCPAEMYAGRIAFMLPPGESR